LLKDKLALDPFILLGAMKGVGKDVQFIFFLGL